MKGRVDWMTDELAALSSENQITLGEVAAQTGLPEGALLELGPSSSIETWSKVLACYGYRIAWDPADPRMCECCAKEPKEALGTLCGPCLFKGRQ